MEIRHLPSFAISIGFSLTSTSKHKQTAGSQAVREYIPNKNIEDG